MVCQIQRIIDDWYGMHMPCRILRKVEEIDEFEREHSEVPPMLWEFVNHDVRIWRMWAKGIVEIVIKVNDQYRLVQDLCYVAAYPNTTTWHGSVFELIRTAEDYWVVFHRED